MFELKMYLSFVLSSIEIALSHVYLELLLVDSVVKQCSFKLVASNYLITSFFILIMRFRTSCLRDRSLITSRNKISQFLKCFHVLMLICICFYEVLLFTKIDFCFDHHFFWKRESNCFLHRLFHCWYQNICFFRSTNCLTS